MGKIKQFLEELLIMIRNRESPLSIKEYIGQKLDTTDQKTIEKYYHDVIEYSKKMS